MRNSTGRRRPNAVRRPSITSRRNAPLCLESCTLPGRFFTRRMWPVWTPAAVVSAGGGTRGVQPTRQVVLSQVAAEQLQSAVRRQFLVHELDVQLSLDHSPQARYAQPHQRGLLCEGSNIGVFSLKTTQEAFLLQSYRIFTQHLFSDWG